MTIEDADLRLDGNSAAGLLAEVFRAEMTTAEVTCTGCGTVAAVAELMRYGHGMGAILRCARCDTAVIRVARTRRRHWLDLRGARTLRLDAATA
jgi:Family of unknown function (DUF6510)